MNKSPKEREYVFDTLTQVCTFSISPIKPLRLEKEKNLRKETVIFERKSEHRATHKPEDLPWIDRRKNPRCLGAFQSV